MLRNWRFGVFTALALALVMAFAAAPALAVTEEDDVVVTATYAPFLEVDWDGAPNIDFGEVRNFTFNEETDQYVSHLGYVRVTVTSNLAYTSTLSVVDGPNAEDGLALANGFDGLLYYRGDGNYHTVIVAGPNGFAGMAGGVGPDQWDQNWFSVTVPLSVPSGRMHVIATFTIAHVV